jgi:hypothetical protein
MIRTVATAAVCTFMVAWLFLAWQLRAGHDPAVGTAVPAAKHATAPAAQNPAPVLVTRTSGG